MNKKYAIVSIVLIALMSLSLFPAVTAFHTPCSGDDLAYEEFGPRPGELLIKIYTDYTSELEGFKNKEIDVMDWALEPLDYLWFETNDPLHEQYATALYAEFGMFQYDINCQVLPTSYASVRQAFAHLLDKDYFIMTYLAGMAHKADSALAHLPGWYNEYLTDLYNLQPRATMDPNQPGFDWPDWEMAYDLIVADLGPPVPDPEDPAYFTWIWPSPFPDPCPHGMPAVADGHLLVYARSEMVPRTEQGNYFRTCIQDLFPQVLVALGKPPARMHVDLLVVPRAITSREVMGEYRYHMYTGGWILSRDPDFLQFYTTDFITKPDGYGWNYVMYSNPDFDEEVMLMLTSPYTGTHTNPCDGVYHAWAAQEIMEGDEPIIPYWNTAGYKAYLANWRGVVNAAGFGVNTWWTFLNGHKVGSEAGDTIRYGFAGDLLSLNPLSAQWYWDWEVLGKIYDTVLSVNPYNVGNDRPWIAASWDTGTWEPTPGEVCTKITFTFREDVWWQDVPPNPARTWPELRAGFTNMPVTPLDYAFTLEYHRDCEDAWNGYLAADVMHVGLNLQAWGDLWPWRQPGNIPPWWDPAEPELWQYDYVIDDPTLGGYQITVYFDLFAPWLALHWIMGLPLLPMHVWQWINIHVAGEIDPWAEDILYGCGPWILLDRTPGVQMTMIPFRNGQSYRGITLERDYFAMPARPAYTSGPNVGISGYKLIFRMPFHYYGTGALPLTYYFTYQAQLWDANAGQWIPLVDGQSPITAAVVQGCTPTEFIYILVLPGSPTAPPQTPSVKFCDWIRVHLDFHWTYTWNGYTYTGVLQEGLPWCTNWWSYYFHVHPADIHAQGVLVGTPPYYGSDGIVNVWDGSAVGLNFMQSVPAGTEPGSLLARADLTGDGIVNVWDGTQVGLFFNRAWP